MPTVLTTRPNVVCHSVVKRRNLLFLGTVATSFLYCASSMSAQSPERATLIEAHLDGCYADCPPIPLPDFYLFCIQAGSEHYIGVHQSWSLGLKKLASMEGQSIPIHHDSAHIWIKLPSSWEIKLNQFNYEYSFKDKGCKEEAQLRSFQHGYTRPAPVPGEPAKPTMRGKLVYGWTLCSSSTPDGLTECTVWDLKGDIRSKGMYRYINDQGSHAPPLAWNESTDGAYKILHLINGQNLQLNEFSLTCNVSHVTK